MIVQRTTGTYVHQPGGYRAFEPRPLPPDPPIDIDDELHTLLSRADRALGRLDGSIGNLPNPDLFVFMYVRKEAVLSSQIEGTQASLGDVLEVEAEILDPSRPKDVVEVLNYINAMSYGLDRLDSLPLSLRLIREIHERLMRGVRGNERSPGAFRTSQNWIGPLGAAIQQAEFVPPPAGRVVETLGALETFLHETVALPPLIKIGLVHAQFETIHPFLDGNGRVGRLLITFLLCQQEILAKPVLYLSHYLKAHRQRYYDLLQATRVQGDWESWLKFFLRGLAEVSNEAAKTSQQIVALRERDRRTVTESFGRIAANGHAALEYLFQRPYLNVKQLADALAINYQTANTLMKRLQVSGIVRETTGSARNRVYCYQSYIDLFARDDFDAT